MKIFSILQDVRYSIIINIESRFQQKLFHMEILSLFASLKISCIDCKTHLLIQCLLILIRSASYVCAKSSRTGASSLNPFSLFSHRTLLDDYIWQCRTTWSAKQSRNEKVWDNANSNYAELACCNTNTYFQTENKRMCLKRSLNFDSSLQINWKDNQTKYRSLCNHHELKESWA